MNLMVPLMLFGWPVVAMVLFSVLPARRAVLCTVIGGWLLLPVAGYSFPGFPDYSKTTATSLAALLGVVVVDWAKLSELRLRWFDLPIAIWCLVPIPSATLAGTGVYAGVSAALVHVISWGVPYLLGRLYFTDAVGLRELALGFFVGGLVYIPLCLIESIKGPYLHFEVYGFMQHTSSQARRYGGWRPMVFLQHGLATGFWMAMATVAGGWLWASKSKRDLWGVPMGWLLTAVTITVVMCRSTGAWALLAAAIGVFVSVRWMKIRVVLVALIVLVPCYSFTRATQIVSESTITAAAGLVFPADRISSLSARLRQEDVITAKVMQRPMLGWGPWGDYREGYTKAVDALWLISFGKYGFTGLSALFATILLPAAIWMWRIPASRWLDPRFAGGSAFSLILTLYMIDCLSNGMQNPTFMLAAGGVGVAAGRLRSEGFGVKATRPPPVHSLDSVHRRMSFVSRPTKS